MGQVLHGRSGSLCRGATLGGRPTGWSGRWTKGQSLVNEEGPGTKNTEGEGVTGKNLGWGGPVSVESVGINTLLSMSSGVGSVLRVECFP